MNALTYGFLEVRRLLVMGVLTLKHAHPVRSLSVERFFQFYFLTEQMENETKAEQCLVRQINHLS